MFYLPPFILFHYTIKVLWKFFLPEKNPLVPRFQTIVLSWAIGI